MMDWFPQRFTTWLMLSLGMIEAILDLKNGVWIHKTLF